MHFILYTVQMLINFHVDVLWTHSKTMTIDAPVEHGVESCNFIHSHLRHIQNLSHFVHGSNWKPSMLPLCQV